MYHGGLALVALCASCRGSLALEDGLSMVQVASVREASAKEATAKEDDRAPRSFGWPAWPWSRAARPPAQPAEQAPPAGAPGHSVTEAEAQATKSKLQSATNAAHVTRLARKAADASSEIAQRRAAEAGLQQQHTAGLNAAAQEADRSRRSGTLAERQGGETSVDAAAGVLSGASERLSDEETKLIADNWAAFYDADVTFSYATHCSAEHGCQNGERPVRGEPSIREMRKNMLNSLRALRFCFGDVLVVLDTPHTAGATAAGIVRQQMNLAKNLSGVPTTRLSIGDQHIASSAVQEGVLGKVDPELLGAAVTTAKAAAELLRDHCAGYTPTWKVQIVDYASSGVQDLAKSHYRIPASAESSMFEKMYPNTMVLDQNFQAKSRYVFHIDAQYRIYRTSWAKDAPNFVEKALSLMRSDARVYMASVVSTPNVDPEHDRTKGVPGAVRGSAPHERMNGLMQGWKPVTGPWSERPVRAETFNANWNAGERKDARKMKLVRLISKDGGSVVSTRQFLMDVDRFKGLFPLAHYDRPADHMWGVNMDEQTPDIGKAYQVFFNETCGVFAGPSEPRLGPGIAG